MIRTYFMGSFKKPRELTWVVGAFVFMVTITFGFTGYLLPWNQKAYWATTVGTEIAGTVPIIGSFITNILRGGTDLSAVTLARFFAVHIWFLPAVIGLMIGVHMYLIIRLGISKIPSQDE